jgi:hypothetical protein
MGAIGKAANDTVERRAVPATPSYGTLSTRDSLRGKSKILRASARTVG